jgi:predicted Zn-dependent peptidase
LQQLLSTGGGLPQVLTYDLLDLPQDYLFRFRDGLEGVTVADVQAAAARHLHVGQQLVVAVVPPAEAEGAAEQLQAAGFEVQRLEL